VRKRFVRAIVLSLLAALTASAQAAESDKIWREFMEWARQPGARFTLEGYRAHLVEQKVPAPQVEERVALIPKLMEKNPKYKAQASAVGFNKLYRTPEQSRFTLEPNAFLVARSKELKPGKALDVAMGQGRNAVYLAAQGWDVTGFDVAEEGLKVAEENAARAGARIRTVQARFDDFDYGQERWDLIYFVYTDAPVVDANYVDRITAALKPGGLVLIDRPFRSLTNAPPEWKETEQDKVNALAKAWSAPGLQIVFYEDTTGYGDWQQTSAKREDYRLRIVRLVARKM